jgi:hypothetical protein
MPNICARNPVKKSEPLRPVAIDQRMQTIRREFLEMPGLCLTIAQACRLWQVGPDDCRRALERLVLDGFLRRTTDGQYARAELTPCRF